MDELKKYIAENFYFLKKEQVEKVTSSLLEFCKKNNISNLKVIGSGESSITFEYNNQIIKLTFIQYGEHKSLKEYVSHSRYILQPDIEEIVDLGYYSAKILKAKKLQVLDDKDLKASSDLIDMYCHLRDDGYLWYDTKLENIGKDENGNMYLIDYGELIYINDMDEYEKKIELESHKIKKPEQSIFYDNLIRERDVRINNRNSERSYSIEEIMKDPKYFAQKFSEGSKSLEELLLFCYANDISTLACCAGHENSRGIKPHDNIVFNVKPEQYEIFSFVLENMLKSKLSNVLNLDLRNPTGQQILFNVGLEDLKYREEFFNSIRILLEKGLTYSSESLYSQIFELYSQFSSKNKEDDTIEVSVKNEGIDFITTGVIYFKEFNEYMLSNKEMSTDKDVLLQYLYSLESIEDLDISSIPNSYHLDLKDIDNIYNMDFINKKKHNML